MQSMQNDSKLQEISQQRLGRIDVFVLQYLFHKSRDPKVFLKELEPEIGCHERNVKVVAATNRWWFPVVLKC